ncbi:MAG: substrate-binding domain-containing protein [Lachnospiraceae bacterium]
MEQWLTEFENEIELVIANNDDMALGAIDAIKRTGAAGIKLVGIDGTPPGLEALEQGDLLGTVACDSQAFSKAILDAACGAAMGEDVSALVELENGRYYWSPQKIVVGE